MSTPIHKDVLDVLKETPCTEINWENSEKKDFYDFLDKYIAPEDSKFNLAFIKLSCMDTMMHRYHTYNAPAVTEDLFSYGIAVQDLIKTVDENTTILVFGDHGGLNGNHGGNDIPLTSTFMFAYRKTPFPMAEYYEKNREKFF